MYGSFVSSLMMFIRQELLALIVVTWTDLWIHTAENLYQRHASSTSSYPCPKWLPNSQSLLLWYSMGWVCKPFSSCICHIQETYQGKKINLKTVDKCYCYKFRLGVINKMSTTQKLLFPVVDGMQNMPWLAHSGLHLHCTNLTTKTPSLMISTPINTK